MNFRTCTTLRKVFILMFAVSIQVSQLVEVSSLLSFLWCGSGFKFIDYAKKSEIPLFVSYRLLLSVLILEDVSRLVIIKVTIKIFSTALKFTFLNKNNR